MGVIGTRGGGRRGAAPDIGERWKVQPFFPPTRGQATTGLVADQYRRCRFKAEATGSQSGHFGKPFESAGPAGARWTNVGPPKSQGR